MVYSFKVIFKPSDEYSGGHAGFLDSIPSRNSWQSKNSRIMVRGDPKKRKPKFDNIQRLGVTCRFHYFWCYCCASTLEIDLSFGQQYSSPAGPHSLEFAIILLSRDHIYTHLSLWANAHLQVSPIGRFIATDRPMFEMIFSHSKNIRTIQLKIQTEMKNVHEWNNCGAWAIHFPLGWEFVRMWNATTRRPHLKTQIHQDADVMKTCGKRCEIFLSEPGNHCTLTLLNKWIVISIGEINQLSASFTPSRMLERCRFWA